jgi:hypothetical protein
VRFVTVLAVVILLVGCSQAAPSVEQQQKRESPERLEKAPPRDPSPDLPAYDVTFEQDCAETGVVGKCYGVSTDATSREELEVVTADLWLDSPGYLAVLVTFYPNKPTADVSAAGFAFENEQAARVVLAQFLAQGTSVEDEVREAMANGGIYVVAPADEAQDDEAQELTQETAIGRAGEAPAGRIVAGYREPSYLRKTIHESVESAQDQYVTALRHAAGKSYPSPDWYGRAALCTCSRTVFCTSGERARRTGEADAAVSVT